MKTAISIEDRLLQEADETAQRMGLTRSRLFALAVAISLIGSGRKDAASSERSFATEADQAEKRLLRESRTKSELAKRALVSEPGRGKFIAGFRTRHWLGASREHPCVLSE